MRISSQPTGDRGNVYVIQDIPGSKIGTPKINIIGATQFGNLKVLLPENSQIILSPTYVITTLRQKLKEYTSKDFLLLTGDPAIIGATQFGNLKVCLPENSQIILSPNYVITTLRQKLKDYTIRDYLLLTGDPAIIGVACSIVSDITNGKYNLLKWDKQEKRYYPVEINLYNKG